MRPRTILLPGFVLLLALACGGSSSSLSVATPAPAPTPVVPAKGLVYTDPAGTGWRLLRSPSSTATRIVLDLVGPSGLKTRGVGFNLQLPAPAPVLFGRFLSDDRVATGLPVQDTGVYFLLNSDPANDGSLPPGSDPLEPKLLVGGVKKGGFLTVGIFQKDRRVAAKESGRPLCRIALEFDPAAHLNAGDRIPLTITKSRYMAEDIGVFSPHPTYDMAAKAHLLDMALAVGTLSAN